MIKKKRILFFHHASNIGGASLSGLNVLKAIPQEQYEIIVYCKSKGGPMFEILKKNGYQVIKGYQSPQSFQHFAGREIFALSIRAILNYFKVILDFITIKKIIRSVDPDIVIVNSMTLFWIGKLAKKLEKETICFFRETYVKGLFGIRTSIIKHGLNKYFDKISFISKFDLNQNIKVGSKKRVIYNAIQPDDFVEHNKKEEQLKIGLNSSHFNILHVGGMLPLKGAEVAIKSLNEMNNDKISLVFVGYKWNGRKKKYIDCKSWKEKIKFIFQIDYEKKCTDLILKYKLSNMIYFFAPQKNISSFYAACDCLLFPAIKPHQARPIFEAGLHRIPVITTDFPNIRENLDENSGFLFENKDIKKLSKIITELASNPNSSRQKTEANYINTMRRHVPTVFKQKIIDLLSND